MAHELKCWPPYFQRVLDGAKTAEYRRNDRKPGFAVGDYLHLREWSPSSGYTGRDLTAWVRDVVYGGEAEGGLFGIPEGYVVMSVRVVHPAVPGEESGG